MFPWLLNTTGNDFLSIQVYQISYKYGLQNIKSNTNIRKAAGSGLNEL